MAKRLSKRINKAALFRDLGYCPHPGQLLVHQSTAPRRVVACGVRWGKTWCAAAEGLAAALQPAAHSIGWIVAPTYDLSERVFTQIVLIAATHLRHRIVTLREHEHRLILRNMGGGLSEIRGKSADNPVSLLGEGLDWLILDEASRLKPLVWQNHLSQRLIDKHGWSLLISTPRGKGWYFDEWRRGQGYDERYESWNMPSWSSPHLDAALIEEERTRLPERTFLQEYGAEFLEGSGAVFRNVREAATGEWQAPVHGEWYYGGLDLAQVNDLTVLVIMNRNREVVFVDRFNKIDWALQIERVRAACDRYNHARVLCDTTGAGQPVFEMLRRGGLFVEPYPFTAKSKSDLVSHLSIWIEQKKIVLPRVELWPEGIDELEAFEYSITDNGNVRTSAPYGMHDDIVVALGLAAWNAKGAAMPAPLRIVGSPSRLPASFRWRLRR